ncbi:MAG TPA: peptidoglycan DD-metalloendopeptidase family protein [Burkholderiales bacterium]|nr:peptidoglycan DD-metalloendopeptidase family protein [Burkholderiales bacterium]
MRGLVLLLAGLFAVPAWGQSKDELRELRVRIENLQRELAASEESREDAADALKESERAISDATRQLAELTAKQREKDGELARLGSEAEHLRQDIAAQQARLARLLHQQYLGGEQDYLRLLLNGEDPNQVARDFHYFGYISRERARWLRSLRENLERLEDNSRRTREEAADLAAIRAEQAAQRERLQREKLERKGILAKVSRQVDEQRKQIGKLQRDEKRLARLVDRLTKLVAPKSSAPGPRNTRVPEPGSESRPFGELKGRLSLPVKGELANRFGSPRPGGGTTWKGLFIRSPEGQEVRAVAAGRVVFADWLRGFGNLLILDHGQGYMSLYGNNETLFSQVGMAVRGGDVVAAVGNSGGNPDSGLYFELRHQGTPLDPMNWVVVR